MKQIFLYILSLTGLLLPLKMQGQDPFYAKVSKNEMKADERVRVDFVLTEKEENFTPPPFKDFYVIMGPSVSQSYSWINGKSSYTKTYTYILQPKKTGVLEIGPATAIIKGQTYTTEPVKIVVDKSTSTTEEGEEKINTSATSVPAGNEKDIFLTLELTENNPYVNQAIGGIYRLYIKDGVNASNFEITQLPEYKGFWVEKVSDKFEGPFTREINGVKYNVYNVSKILLFPQQAGTLKIKPLKATIYRIKYEERVFGFFREMVEVPVKLTLSSGTKIIRVKELPQEGKPPEFSGAVGKFDLQLFTDKDTVRTGEALTIRLKVSGKGNLGLIDLPGLNLPPDLEVFEPEIKRNYRPTLSGYKGSLEKIFTVIPQKSGKYIIPPVKFAYFDPKTGKYNLLQTEERMLYVTGTSKTASLTSTGTPASAGMGLQPLMEKPHWKNISAPAFFGSKRFIWLSILPFILLLIAWLYKKYRERILSRPDVIHRKKVKSELNALLSEAAKQKNDKEKFYGTLEKILFTYFKEKFGLKPVEVTKENIFKRLQQAGAGEEITGRTETLWQKIQSARYTPIAAADMETDLKSLKSLLNELDKLNIR